MCDTFCSDKESQSLLLLELHAVVKRVLVLVETIFLSVYEYTVIAYRITYYSW